MSCIGKARSPQFIAITSPQPQPQPPGPAQPPLQTQRFHCFRYFGASCPSVRPSGRTSQGEVPGLAPLRALSFRVAFKKCALRAKTL